MYSFLVILKFLLGYKYKLQLTQNLRKYEREREWTHNIIIERIARL